MAHLEREAVVSAIKSTSNLTAAADKLGASRRTLQNRMRQYGLPPGKRGRPRHELPFGGGFVDGAADVLGLAVMFGLGYLTYRAFSSTERVVGADAEREYLLGIDLSL